MSAPPVLHSPRSPSGIHRWAHCLGSVEAQAGIPDETSEWAAQGTLFHTIMAACLDRPRLQPADYLDEVRTIDGHEVVCDKEMVRHLEDGLDWVAEQPGKLFVERKVSLERWMPGEWGTTDIGMVPRDYILIADWKYGSEPVEVKENEQLQAYALGFWNWYTSRYDVEPRYLSKRFPVRIVIRQPRIPGGGGTWETTVGRLLDFGDWLSERHKLSLKGGPRKAGKKICRWCRARLSCDTHLKLVSSIIGAKLDGLQAPEISPPRVLTPEARSFVLLNWSMVERWKKDIHAEALNDALKGRPVPGMKVIKGRAGARQWVDEAAAEKAMWAIDHLPGDKILKRVLASPAEIEKEITKTEYKTLAGNVTQAEAKPVLVDQSDSGELFEDYQAKLEKLEGKL